MPRHSPPPIGHGHNQNNTMKTKVIMIIAALTATAIAGSGLMCRACNGTGWRNSVKCIHCGGDGES